MVSDDIPQPSGALKTSSQRTAFQCIAIVLAAALLCLPCLTVGLPRGYDSEDHAQYQFHFSQQFWNGDLYPRWLAGGNKGLGTPIFLVQYPLPYFATALLRPITFFGDADTREARELGVIFFLALAAAGLSARAWFRTRCRPTVATLAAILYISLPYIWGQAIYLRSAIGDAFAFIWMPLALAICDRIISKPRISSVLVAALSLTVALLLLSHVLTAALFIPVLAGYMLASRKPGWLSFGGILKSLLIALTIGPGIAAIYLVPLAAYHHLIDLKKLPEHIPMTELGRWFSYLGPDSWSRLFLIPGALAAGSLAILAGVFIWRSRQSAAERLIMALVLSLGVAMLVPGLGPWLLLNSGLKLTGFETFGDFGARMLFTSLSLLALGVLGYSIRSKNVTLRDKWLLLVACGAFVMMLPWTAMIWSAVPQLSMLQFPFRFCGVLAVAAMGLYAVALDRARHNRAAGKKALVYLALAAITTVGGGILTWRVVARYLQPETATLAVQKNVDIMFRTYVPSEHLMAFAQRMGTHPGGFDIPLTPIDQTVYGECASGEGDVKVAAAGPRRFRVSSTCSGDAPVRIAQLYFPLWRIEPIEGWYPARLLPKSSPDGLVEVFFGPGRHHFDLVFDPGWPEQAGAFVSGASLLAVAAGLILRPKRGPWAQQRLEKSDQRVAVYQ